ncbi:MAG: hypothetical protein N2512_11000 [Armatimonadetes bacterium]|nr:hypothetical protein [Armatimonadota bacterium]
MTARSAGVAVGVFAISVGLAAPPGQVAVQLLRPCYRNAIYPTENLQEIVFRVSAQGIEPETIREIRCALLDAAGRRLGEKDVPGGQVAAPISLPAADLPVGNYVLTVALVDGEGAVLGAGQVSLRKLPPPPAGDEVRIDENRNVLVNGRPLFTIGWYGTVPTEDPRPDVVALQNVETPVVLSPRDAGRIGERFRKHGIYSIVSVENGRLYYSFDLWREENAALRHVADEYKTLAEPSEDTKRLVRELVEAVRGQPGLLGYYIADEPEINDMRPEYLEAYYRYLCEIDPYHPVFVTNCVIEGIATHGYRCADVLNPDPYSPAWDYVPKFLKKVNEVGAVGKSTYVTLWHASHQAHFTAKYGTAPPYPYRVFRNQYLVSVALGAKGFTAYTSPFFLEEVQYRHGLPYVWRELRFLEKAILAAPPTEPLSVEVEGARELAAWARQVGPHVYLVLVHHNSGHARARVRWAPLKGRPELVVLSEGRKVRVNEDVFEDAFAEGDAHVYTDDPAARDFPTCQEIVAELERREKDLIKPGNLLHWTRGVTARASAGYYAPWFPQWFYYAINGMTDDMGWSAYGWGGKPAWVEFAFPRAETVGRLVLYTPNLQDYQIDLFAPSGRVFRTTVAGNEREEIVHDFRPALRCLRIRVTATAVRPCDRPNGQAPLLSEIEAYAEPGDGPTTLVEEITPDLGPLPKVLFAGPADGNALWEDDFGDFQVADRFFGDERDTKWVAAPGKLRIETHPRGGITLACVSEEGWANLSRVIPYDPAYRFLQVCLSHIEGEGYKFAYVGLNDSSGEPGFRGCINTSWPGIYTVDTHYIHEKFRAGQLQRGFLVLSVAGSRKAEDGTILPGPSFTFDWARLVRRPTDGVVVTLADGSPLPEALREGDRLHFEVHLSAPADDVAVEACGGPTYEPIAINGEPAVQLRPADETRQVWVAEVAIGPGTGKFTPKGYPVVFKARVVGGQIEETLASAFVAFE